jgi:hypothetical protein
MVGSAPEWSRNFLHRKDRSSSSFSASRSFLKAVRGNFQVSFKRSRSNRSTSAPLSTRKLQILTLACEQAYCRRLGVYPTAIVGRLTKSNDRPVASQSLIYASPTASNLIKPPKSSHSTRPKTLDELSTWLYDDTIGCNEVVWSTLCLSPKYAAMGGPLASKTCWTCKAE